MFWWEHVDTRKHFSEHSWLSGLILSILAHQAHLAQSHFSLIFRAINTYNRSWFDLIEKRFAVTRDNSLVKSDQCLRLFSSRRQPPLLVTRPDTRLPQSRAGGQGLYLRSLDHLGRSSEAKDRKNQKEVKCDGRTNWRTNGRTDRPTDISSYRDASTHLKM